MSTTELQQIIDQRSPAEQEWMTTYLLGKVKVARELRQTPEQLAELSSRTADILAGRNRVTQAEAEAHWDAMDRVKK